MPRALIPQNGSYLAELFLPEGHELLGMVRRTSHDSCERIDHLLDRIEVVAADSSEMLGKVVEAPRRELQWAP